MKKFGIVMLIVIMSFNVFAAKTVVVGSKMFTEGYIIANMISYLLKDAGFKVEEQFGLTSFPLRAAIENGQVDIYSEYTGTAWAAYFKQKKNIYNPYELFNEVSKLDYEKNKIVWINMIPFNDTYAMAVKSEFAEKNNLRTLSDLAKFVNEGNKVIFGVNPEFYERADGFFAMARAYNMNVPKKM
ncbi:ABC transporter substrate-binding protein [Marinitoga lauensis]|uniref:ABC transporter substrate-binding protein n=1 Tax=Marinitoga lauensis TaxID=2201189 RepID=UPI0023EA518E|nr:glycine betaine ABC transporter substrate-binding protein [Marinitoga lauensis]